MTFKKAESWWLKATEVERLVVCATARISDTYAKWNWASLEYPARAAILNALETYACPKARVQE